MISATDALGTWTATYNHQGLLATVRNPANQIHHSVTYNIDDRPISVTDAQNVVTTRTFDYLGRVLTRKQGTLPDEVFTYTARGLTNHTDQLGKLTKYTLDAALRKTAETTPNNETVTYTHNAAGNVLTLTDHRGKVTTWTYDVEGRMRTKKYHGQTFANLEYTYNANSQVATRKFWSSASVNRQTSYGYDDVGNLTSITYPAGTPSVTFGYNARNQLSSMSDPVFGATTFDYNANGLLSYEQPPWASSRVTYGYNNAQLRSQLTLQQPNLSWVQNYGYNNSRRLTSLTATSISGTPFAYTYLGASRRVSQITFPNGGKVVNSYDSLARLTATRLRRQDNVDLNKHEYLYNDRHERTKHTRMDNSYVDFGYDNLGQLTNAPGYNSGGTPIANEQLRYTYDGGWNMTARTQNGVASSYTVNDRNQVTSAGGMACSFDINGNLTNRVYDATGPKTYNYFYDDENRLIEARTDTSSTATASRWRSTWVYDGLSRARIKTDYTWSGSTWAVAGETRYLYDGRRVIQERNSANTPTVTYTRGPDLSGSLEGAGGIGGLLARSHGYSAGTWSSHNYYHADGGGNITALLDNHATVAATSATYRYDPYGRLLASDGGMAAANAYRFSSKGVQPSSGLYYYGFRFYDPTLQRWLNRDPIFEAGGINLYGFVGNNPMMFVDPYGEAWYEWGWIDTAANFCAGAADDLTLGGSNLLRDGLGWNDNVDKGSGAYSGGGYTAAAAGMFTPTGFAKGVGKAAGKKLGATVGHHSIPKAAMKQMPAKVRHDPRVRGARGKPNITQVDEAAHRKAHSSPPGDYYPGGDYNRAYDEAVNQAGGYPNLTPETARQLADQCMGNFFK